jgi:hypothetical protein
MRLKKLGILVVGFDLVEDGRFDIADAFENFPNESVNR